MGCKRISEYTEYCYVSCIGYNTSVLEINTDCYDGCNENRKCFKQCYKWNNVYGGNELNKNCYHGCVDPSDYDKNNTSSNQTDNDSSDNSIGSHVEPNTVLLFPNFMLFIFLKY